MSDLWWCWGLLFIGVAVGLYYGIRSQIRRRATVPGPVTPDELGVGPEADKENPEYHRGESAGEATAETYEDSAKTLGHG